MLWLEVARTDTSPVDISDPVVAMKARVLAAMTVAAIAAAVACVPADVAASRSANVSVTSLPGGGVGAAPSGIEIAVVRMTLVAVALTSMLVEALTLAFRQ